MKEHLSRLLHRPWLTILRRLVLVWLVFVALGCLSSAARAWECDFYGCMPVYVPLTIISLTGCVLVPLVGLVMLAVWGWRVRCRRRREQLAAAAAEAVDPEVGVQMELPLTFPPPTPPAQGKLRRWWDVWVFLFALLVCVPLSYWYHYRADNRSTLQVSCQGAHGDYVFARAAWNSDDATAEGVAERLPATAPYLHTFHLPDGDFQVDCQTGSTVFALSHIRGTRRFTLKPHFNIEGEVELYICSIINDEDRKRVKTLLNYYMNNPQARRPRIRRMNFTRCQDAAVLYLDYGEYVLLPVPKGTEPSEAPALIYISLLP